MRPGRTETTDPAAPADPRPAAPVTGDPPETEAGDAPETRDTPETGDPETADPETTDTETTDTGTTDTGAGEAGAEVAGGVAAEPDRTGEPSQEEPEEDRWAAFAPEPGRAPGRLRRTAAALGRGLGHEWTLAVLGALALAVALTWPALRYPAYTLPQDLADPTLVSWLLAWPGHILLTDPGQLWHGNAFFPDRWSYAFTDSLLGYAPAGMLGDGPLAAVARYNVIFVLAHALAFLGAYTLVRQLGAARAAALVAGIAFAYAPWRLGQAGHLHVLSTGGIALALAMLARGHGWSLRRRPRPGPVRPAWIVAGWLVAAWQIDRKSVV